METPTQAQPPESRAPAPHMSLTPRQPFQFGIRWIFALTAAVAVFVTVMFVLRDDVAGPIMLALLPVELAIIATICVFGSGWLRAFMLGAAIPLGILAVGVGHGLGNLFYYYTVINREMSVDRRLDLPNVIKDGASILRIWIGWASLVSVLSGIVCLLIWYCLPAKSDGTR
jgi:hypothetical protein